MKLSTKARYGLRAMLDLAEHNGMGPIQARLVAERQEISPKYLEHLLAALKAANLVTVVRGARGGYQLARQAREITLGEVVRALEGSLALVECTDNPSLCSRAPGCATREIWNELKVAIEDILESTSVADLVGRNRDKRNALGQVMYHI